MASIEFNISFYRDSLILLESNFILKIFDKLNNKLILVITKVCNTITRDLIIDKVYTILVTIKTI